MAENMTEDLFENFEKDNAVSQELCDKYEAILLRELIALWKNMVLEASWEDISSNQKNCTSMNPLSKLAYLIFIHRRTGFSGLLEIRTFNKYISFFKCSITPIRYIDA